MVRIDLKQAGLLVLAGATFVGLALTAPAAVSAVIASAVLGL